MTLNIERETELINVSEKSYTSRKIWNRANSKHIKDYKFTLSFFHWNQGNVENL